MTRPLHILCDLDDTVVDLLGPWIREYNLGARWSARHSHIEHASIKSYDIRKCVRDPELMLDIIERSGFFAGLPPLPGAIEGVCDLMAHGHRVTFVSIAYEFHVLAEKAEWVAKYFGRAGFGAASRMNTLISYGRFDKAHIPADVLIDDAAHHLKSYRARHPQALLVGIGQPHTYAEGGDRYADQIWPWTDPITGWKGIVAAVKKRSEELP